MPAVATCACAVTNADQQSPSLANIVGDKRCGRKRQAVLDDKEVAAFPGPRLRHFKKQGSVEEQLKTRPSPVQVELKLRSLQPSE